MEPYDVEDGVAYGCEPATNAKDVRGAIAFVFRGKCTFTQKIALAQKAGAKAVVIGNSDDNLFTMVVDDEEAVTVPVLAATNHTGELLASVLVLDEPARASLKYGTDESKVQTESRRAAYPSKHGLIYPHGGVDSFDYLGAEFGRAVRCEPYTLALAEPEDACSALAPVEPKGAAVLVTRGECTFVDKARAVQRAGGGLMLLTNNEDGFFHMPFGTENTEDLEIPAIMATQAAGRFLRAAAERGVAAAAAASPGAPSGLELSIVQSLECMTAEEEQALQDVESEQSAARKEAT